MGNNGTREVRLGSFDVEQDGEHTGVGFAQISRIFATQGALFFGTDDDPAEECKWNAQMN